MKKQITLLLTLIIVALSIWLAFPHEPERFLISSDDDLISFSGVVRGGIRPQIITERADDHPIFISPIYSLEPNYYTPPEPIEIFARTQENQSLYIYDQLSGGWSEIVENQNILWPRFTRFALGESLDMQMPNFIDDKISLKDRAPLQTSGYRLAIKFFLDDLTEPFIHTNTFEQGGCDGVFMHTPQRKYSSIFRTAQLPVAGINREVEIEIRATWFLDNSMQKSCNLEISSQ